MTAGRVCKRARRASFVSDVAPGTAGYSHASDEASLTRHPHAMSAPLLQGLRESTVAQDWKVPEAAGGQTPPDAGLALWIEVTTRAINGEGSAAHALMTDAWAVAQRSRRAAACLWEMLAHAVRDGVPGFGVDADGSDERHEGAAYLQQAMRLVVGGANQARASSLDRLLLAVAVEACRELAAKDGFNWKLGNVLRRGDVEVLRQSGQTALANARASPGFRAALGRPVQEACAAEIARARGDGREPSNLSEPVERTGAGLTD